MTEEQRIKGIQELLSRISPLNYESIGLQVKRSAEKGKYYNSYDQADLDKLRQTEKKIADLESQLQTLFKELRSLQRKYRVQYKGVFASDGSEFIQKPERKY